ncbi:MAG TPA: hypothetical protein PLK02_07420, partial [Paludibacteraceae bacterium]|nr:hypothetical protein [Paludibacteraceae bacterium]
TSLTSLTIGNSVITIGNGAFLNCTSLLQLTAPERFKTSDGGNVHPSIKYLIDNFETVVTWVKTNEELTAVANTTAQKAAQDNANNASGENPYATINDLVGGVPTGGTTGQVLAKKSNTDYDTEWVKGGIAGVQKNGTDLTPDENNKVNVSVPTQPSDIGAQAALGFTPENSANKNTANGYAGLGADSQITLAASPIGKILSDTTYEPTWISGASYDSASKTFTLVGHTVVNTDVIEFRENTGVLPANIQAYNIDEVGGQYYNAINVSGSTFQICDTVGGETPFTTSDDGTAGWQFRICPQSMTIKGLNLANLKNIRLLFSIQYAKRTTSPTLIRGCLNSQTTNAVYQNNSVDNFLSRFVFNSVSAFSKYIFSTGKIELLRLSSSSCFMFNNISFKHSADKSTWANVSQSAGTAENKVTALRAEVESLLIDGNTAGHLAIRSINIQIQQL